MIHILEYLKKHGQLLDSDIAKEMGMSVATVRQRVASLRATGAVVTCDLTRFENGKQTQAWVCRASGYTPPAAPGRKAKPTLCAAAISGSGTRAASSNRSGANIKPASAGLCLLAALYGM